MKRLSFRFVRRLMLLLALVFPVVYLLGGFVAALAGSHGNVTLAQDDEVVTSSRIVDYNQLVDMDDDYSFSAADYSVNVINGRVTISSSNKNSTNYSILPKSVSTIRGHVYCFYVNSSGNAQSGTTWQLYNSDLGIYGTTNYTIFTETISRTSTFRAAVYNGASIDVSYYVEFFDLTQMFPDSPTYASLSAYYDLSVYQPYSLGEKQVKETTGTPTYSEYLFNQILGSDNIIKQWGYYALSDEEKGFAPFASLIKIVDDNFFHLGDSNDLGLFVYGYVYYALNIVAIYELVALVVMVFTIPLKLTDRFTKEM